MLEVIAIDIKDVENISKSKATQIELCIDIENDGLSPSVQLIKEAIKISTKKIRVMLRVHYDNFLLNEDRLKKIINFINKTKNLNFDGYVFGVIDNNGLVDFEILNLVLEKISNKNMTFHKAIDLSLNLVNDINELTNKENIKYILTSGGLDKPENNVKKLNKIINKQKILIGGGVSIDTIKKLKPIGFYNFHIGRAARVENTYKNPIDITKINSIVNIIEE